MNNLIEVQNFFNEQFDFLKLKLDTQSYIEKILKESEEDFFSDYINDEQGVLELKNMTVKYDSTKIIINCEDSNPTFQMKFYLYKEVTSIPDFTYEVEYNMKGEFLDEYFLEY